MNFAHDSTRFGTVTYLADSVRDFHRETGFEPVVDAALVAQVEGLVLAAAILPLAEEVDVTRSFIHAQFEDQLVAALVRDFGGQMPEEKIFA